MKTTTAKEIKFEHTIIGWCIRYDEPIVLVRLAGQGPKGKLAGTAYYYPKNDEVVLDNAKTGIHRVGGWRGVDVAGLEESVIPVAKEWIAANPNALSEYLAARQEQFIRGLTDTIEKRQQELSKLTEQLAQATAGVTQEQIWKQEREARYAQYRTEDRTTDENYTPEDNEAATADNA